MNTLEKIKKAGWTEVERQQKELERLKEIWGSDYKLQHAIPETAGRIKGMVYILNMLK